MIVTAYRACCLAAVSSIALIATAAAAQTTGEQPTTAAQDNAGQPQAGGSLTSSPSVSDASMQREDDIVVTGTRASLENAERIKREASVLVDGVSADDIGALPDVAIAESLVRIPGITSNDREGGFEQVSVRGLGPDLTQVTFNGRTFPAVSLPDRRVNLGDLPTEGLASAVIQKTSDAATIEGGLSGTIGLQSIRPLETSRRGLTVFVRGIYDSIANKTEGAYGAKDLGLRGELSYIHRFSDRFGVALNYAYIEQTNVSPSVQFDQPRFGTGTRADLDRNGVSESFPVNAGARVGSTNQRRHSAIGTIQWEPTETLRVTADGLFIKDAGSRNIQRFFATGTNANLPLPTSFTVTEDVVTQFDGQTSLYREILTDDETSNEQFQGGLNLAYDNDGGLRVTLDASYARAQRGGTDRQLTTENDAATAVAQRLNAAFDYRDRKDPKLTFVPLVADDYALSEILLNRARGSDTIKAGRVDIIRDVSLPLFNSLAFGVRIEDRAKRNNPDQTSYGFGTAANIAGRPDLDGTFLNVQRNPYLNVARYLGGPTVAMFPLFDVDKVLSLRNAAGVIVNDQAGQDIAARSTVEETTYAFYGQANIKAGPITGNVGVRYFLTDQTIDGFSGTNEANKVALGASRTYAFWLPTLNLRWALADPLALRFSAYETASRATFGAVRLGSAIDLNNIAANPTIARGNPDLKPYTAKNLDASVEWYPNRATTVAVQGFYKFVKTFIDNQSLPGTIDLPNGTSIPATINTSVNDPTVRDFYGIEIIVRRDFDFLPGFLRNLGIRADFERNWTNATQTIGGINGAATVGAISGGAVQTTVMPNNFTEKLFNAQLYYSSKVVDLRLAYRTYSHYLRQADNAYQIRPGGTFDLSGSFQLMKNVRLTGYVANLTNAKTYEYFPDYRHPDSKAALRNTIWDGRVVTLGVRANF